ncbi:hypothetical protein [Pedobacter aquatilis]|uniref:hypothetical protein n=1 Tax=Pedobacter aquatilis TaxID=351343 RepID=UPI002931670E|nr:hypothetical protein [Pedobacter aquatilis]
MEVTTMLHKSNIIIHVSAGTFALLAGLLILCSRKGGRLHIVSGRIFLCLLAIVILTGLAGVFIFNRNSFLLVITTLSGYMGFSGFRSVRNRSNKPRILDIFAAILALLSVLSFLLYFKAIGMIWSPVIIFSTVGYLVMVVCYDLARYLFSHQTYQKLWLQEHILKMTSAFSGLLSAFSGTVFPQYQPYSQFLPSVLGSLIAMGFMFGFWRKIRKGALSLDAG